MRFVSFASGSSGNCSVLSAGDTHLMIDAGISNKKIETRLKETGLSPDEIAGICVTHEHVDHINGLRVFLKKHPTKVYATAGTLAGIKQKFGDEVDESLFVEIKSDQEFQVEGLDVASFSTDHDAYDSCGFRVEAGGKHFALATDLGTFSDYTVRALSDLDFMLLEANHDVRMLEVGPYPYYLKTRILGRNGHLSNETAGALFSEVFNKKMTKLLLGHISVENNYPELARQAVIVEAESQLGHGLTDVLDVETAPRDEVSQLYLF